MVDAKTSAHDRLAEELSAQQQKIVALRKEVSELIDKNQAAENASVSAKFREQALQQEVDLLKKNNQWYEDELKRRNTEYANYRKEKGARVAELQRLYEDATQDAEALHRTEITLRNRIDDLTQKAEDAFARIQSLQEEAAKSQESFRIDLESARRLADLQKQSADTAKARLQEVQRAYDQVREDAADEIGQMQAEVESEHTAREAAESRIAELESQIESLQNEAAVTYRGPSQPVTPRRGVNGIGGHGTPGRVGSPMRTSTPSASRTKGDGSSGAYGDHMQLKAQLEHERRRNERLKTTIEQMVVELEKKGPEVEDLRLDHERLTADVAELSKVLDQTTKERDKLRKEARKWEGQVAGLSREAELLRQQIRDHSLQIKVLLMEIQAREEGLEGLSLVQQQQLEQIVRGELEEAVTSGMSATGQVITQRLVIFRNIGELQDQNAKLLNLTRKLGEEMEGEEARAQREQHKRDQEELQELREKAVQHTEEVKLLVAKSESYIRERDMFRKVLSQSQRGPAPPASDAGSIFDGPPQFGSPAQRAHSVETVESQQLIESTKVLKELQSHFDAYRQEATVDRSALKQQVDKLSKEKGEMHGELTRVNGQLQLAHERYELLQTNFNGLKNEHAELQKRAQALSEATAKQDIRTQQVAEELAEAKATADGLRSEAATLKAERELWKKIESRLTDDNRNLTEERSRLNKMIGGLQNLQNERELVDSETRRKLQSRADNLESELQSVKRKLDQETEESKKLALRKEYEQQQNRTRIDDLVKGAGNLREELATVKTQRDELQNRVDELRIELRNAEDKATALQPRPTARPQRAAADEASTAETEDVADRVEELTIEVADLKRDLRYRQKEVDLAKEAAQGFRSIAETAEENLQSITETYDRYREETDRLLAEKDGQISDLEKRVEEISSELAKTNTDLTELRSKAEEAVTKFNEQKSELEADIARLGDENDRLTETTKLHREDLKAQAEIAQQAQENYEDELLKHSEATRNLQAVRSELNTLKTEVAGYKAEAEAAKATLSENQETWAETRDRYERELTDLRSRREEVNAQNRLLHNQLDEVSRQIESLKQSRTSLGASPSPAAAVHDAGTENLQEIIRYLRQEKEIVDMQYDLTLRESERLKHQLEYTQQQLDATREKLNQERQSQTDRELSNMNYNKLMQSINELNLFRESNAALRTEARLAQEKLTERQKEVEELASQLQPLQAKAIELEADLEYKDGEIKLLQQDREHWQKRAHDILHKYDRVDPAELEGLRNQITTLQTERDQVITEKQSLQEQVDGIEERIRIVREETHNEFEQRKANIINQSREKARKDREIINDKQAQIDAIRNEKDRLTEELASIREELEHTKAARDEAIANAQSRDNATRIESALEEGQVLDDAAGVISADAKAALEAELAAAKQFAEEKAVRIAELESQVQLFQSQIVDLHARIQELEDAAVGLPSHWKDDFQKELTSPQAREGAAVAEPSASKELEKVRSELATAQQQIQDLQVMASATTTTVGDGSSLDQQVAAIRNELQRKHDEVVQNLESKFQERVSSMKSQLNTKLKEGREMMRPKLLEELAQEHEANLQHLREVHETEIRRLNEEHQAELRRVRSEVQAATVQPSVVTQPASDGEPASIKLEPSAFTGESELSKEQVRNLLENQPVLKTMITNNMKKKISEAIDKEKETIRIEIREEQEKLTAANLEEAAKQANENKEKAVAQAKELESKRMSVKINMSENRSKQAQAKLEVIETAARETPQRPVGEVWEIAKNAKPQVQTPSQQAVAPKPPILLQNAQPTQTPPSQPQAQTQQPPVSAPAGPPATAPSGPQVQQTVSERNQSAITQTAPTAPAPIPPFESQQDFGGAKPPSDVSQQQIPFSAPRMSMGYWQPPQMQQGGRSQFGSASFGTGPATLRNIISQNTGPQNMGTGGPMNQSGIPRPGVQPQQPQLLQRGGRGGGRGGFGYQGQPPQQQQQPQQPQQPQMQNQQSSFAIAGTTANNVNRGGSNLPRAPATRGGRGNRGGGSNPQMGSGGIMRGGMNPTARNFTPSGPSAANNKRKADGVPGPDTPDKRARSHE